MKLCWYVLIFWLPSFEPWPIQDLENEFPVRWCSDSAPRKGQRLAANQRCNTNQLAARASLLSSWHMFTCTWDCISLSWTLELSPPSSGWPRVTTRFHYGSICQNCSSRVATNLLNWHRCWTPELPLLAPQCGDSSDLWSSQCSSKAVSIKRSLESRLENLLDSSETSTSWPQRLCSDLQQCRLSMARLPRCTWHHCWS